MSRRRPFGDSGFGDDFPPAGGEPLENLEEEPVNQPGAAASVNQPEAEASVNQPEAEESVNQPEAEASVNPPEAEASVNPPDNAAPAQYAALPQQAGQPDNLPLNQPEPINNMATGS